MLEIVIEINDIFPGIAGFAPPLPDLANTTRIFFSFQLADYKETTD